MFNRLDCQPDAHGLLVLALPDLQLSVPLLRILRIVRDVFCRPAKSGGR